MPRAKHIDVCMGRRNINKLDYYDDYYYTSQITLLLPINQQSPSSSAPTMLFSPLLLTGCTALACRPKGLQSDHGQAGHDKEDRGKQSTLRGAALQSQEDPRPPTAASRLTLRRHLHHLAEPDQRPLFANRSGVDCLGPGTSKGGHSS